MKHQIWLVWSWFFIYRPFHVFCTCHFLGSKTGQTNEAVISYCKSSLATDQFDLAGIKNAKPSWESYSSPHTMGEMTPLLTTGLGELAPPHNWGGRPSGPDWPTQLLCRNTSWALGCPNWYLPHQWPVWRYWSWGMIVVGSPWLGTTADYPRGF